DSSDSAGGAVPGPASPGGHAAAPPDHSAGSGVPSGAAYGAATADAADHAAGTGDLPDAAVDRPGSGAGLLAGRAGRHSADPAARGAGGDDPVGRHPGHA